MPPSRTGRRAAQTVTRLRRTRIALLGYPMNGMGDILYDPAALLRRLGPTGHRRGSGRLVRAHRGGERRRRSTRCSASHAQRFAIAERSAARAPRLRRAHRARHPGHARGRWLRRLLVSLRLDRWRRALRAAAAARRLKPHGRRLRLRRRGRHEHGHTDGRRPDADRAGLAHFSEMYAMDWERDSVLDQPHGGGQLAHRPRGPARPADRPPAGHRAAWTIRPRPVFSARPGACTTAALVADRRRALPAGRRPRRGAGHARAAQGRDALLPLPPRDRDGARSWTPGCATAAPITS